MSASGPIAIGGAGAFGTALAAVIARSTGQPVPLLARDAARAAEIANTRENRRYLPGIVLPEGVAPTTDAQVLLDAGTVLFAMPSQVQRSAAGALADFLRPETAIVICAKGLEKATGRRLTEVLAEELPGERHIAVLSGPGFATDIASGLPTAMTLAAADLGAAEALAAALSGATFRLYASDDPVGVQIGGALKNVLAIGSGIVEGAGLGESARAALIARGVAELTRFAVAHGARPETMAGLAGLGDLVLTATSRQSRNLRFGIALGQGGHAGDLLGPNALLTEGAYTAAIASGIARESGIPMPITDAVSAIIDGRMTVAEALKALMERPLTTEGR
jgi:glycerol-3-phosphate dehydrogenase (NAD(P)+)